MVAPFGNGRYYIEIRDHAANVIRQLPYRNVQLTVGLGSNGQTLTFDTNFRGLGLTFAKFYPGVHEIWLWDTEVPSWPIFAGPVTQLTVNSDGTMTINCSDPLWYLSRRVLSTIELYTGKPEAAMHDLLSFANGELATGMLAHTDQVSTTNISFQCGQGLPQISDLLSQLQDMGDGVDYYVRNDGGGMTNQRWLHLWGGKKGSAPGVLPLGVNFPSEIMPAYSLQLNATGLANQVFIVGSTSGFGEADSPSALTEYGALYQMASDASQTTGTTLNKQAKTLLKSVKFTLQIPSITVYSKYLSPYVDFDMGDKIKVTINDDYVQYAEVQRIVGFQLTIKPNDDSVTNIYTNATDEVDA